MHKIILLFLLLILTTSATQAEQLTLLKQLKKSSRQQVIEVIDGNTVILKDQTYVRLVGIQTPKLPLSRKKRTEWPLAAEAQKRLSDLILNRYATLYFGGQKADRYGRALAHLVREDGVWIQGEMLKNGLAQVFTFPDNNAVVPEMMALEMTARQKKRGIWALDYYQPKDHQMSGPHRNSFQLVTGIPRNVTKVRGTYYVNFGDNWRKDFTIVIKSRAARKFIKSGIPPESLKGKKIEVRGWLKSYNGPMIEATHPEQITITQ